MTAWTDQFVGDRMAVDREFTERVAASEFSSQEWGTIMTAVEFDIEDPETPEQARVVADTSKVEQVLPALQEMRDEAAFGGVPSGGGGGSGGGGSGAGGRGGGSGGGSGLFDSLKSSLGLGGDSAADHRADAAVALADEYARQFQEHLQEHGKWERACAVAAASADTDRGMHAEGADADAGSPETSAASGTQPGESDEGSEADADES